MLDANVTYGQMIKKNRAFQQQTLTVKERMVEDLGCSVEGYSPEALGSLLGVMASWIFALLYMLSFVVRDLQWSIKSSGIFLNTQKKKKKFLLLSGIHS